MEALRMRVSMSAIGSVIMGSPARLDHARDLAAERQHAQANPAQLELAVIASRPPAHLAPVVMADDELGPAIEFRKLRSTRHVFLCDQVARKGMPSCWSSARPSSSVLAVVTMLMFKPLIASI